MTLYTKVLSMLAENEKLLQLIALWEQSLDDDIPFPKGRLIGDWDSAKPGDRVLMTYIDPYRVVKGFILTLPGHPDYGILVNGIVQYKDEDDRANWILLKHVAIFAETIELETSL